MTSTNADAVVAIYQAGIDEGNATFESAPRPGPSSTRPSCPRVDALMQALIESTEVAGIWTIQAGIFPENEASILHRSLGVRTVGLRERIGLHHGRWRDVELMERRSALV